MSEYLSIMYNAGDNSKLTLEWEFLDTPPAKSWRNMLEYTMLNPNDPPLALTENYFCNTSDEARVIWDELRIELSKFRSPLGKVPFVKLTETVCDNTIRFLMDLVETGRLGEIKKTMHINGLIDKTKHLLFYVTRVREPLKGTSNSESAFGEIRHYPDPHFAIEFKSEWLEYLTMDIVPGTLYAELDYVDLAWHDILRFGEMRNAYSAFKEKRFGPPAHMGSGHIIPFSQDLGGIATDVLSFMHHNRAAIKHIDPDFDPVYAWSCCGRIPIASLRTSIGERGYPGYTELARTSKVFKVEILED